jgi:hypothetical protein
MLKNFLVMLAPVVLSLAFVAGCSCQAPAAVTPQPPRPAFTGNGVKVIAVLPFHASTDSPYSGTEFAQMVADALKTTGKYKVYGPSELPFTPSEFYPRTDRLQPTDRELAQLRTLKDVDAYVTGTIDFHAGQLRDRREHAPRYPQSRQALYTATSDGIAPYYEREYLNEVVTVAVSASVVSLVDGRNIWSSPSPVLATTAYCGWGVRSPVGLYEQPTDKALQMITMELAPRHAVAQAPLAKTSPAVVQTPTPLTAKERPPTTMPQSGR